MILSKGKKPRLLQEHQENTANLTQQIQELLCTKTTRTPIVHVVQVSNNQEKRGTFLRPINQLFTKGLTGKNKKHELTFKLLPVTTLYGEEAMELVCNEDIHIEEGIIEIDTGISVNIMGNMKLVLTPKYGKRMDFVSVNPKYTDNRAVAKKKEIEQEQEKENENENENENEITNSSDTEEHIDTKGIEKPKIVPVPENTNPLPITIYGNFEGTIMVRINCEEGQDIIPKHRALYVCETLIYGIEQK